MARLDDVLDAPPEEGGATSLQPVPSLAGAIELRNVGFSYGGPDRGNILDDIDLKIAPGSFVAVVGRSGSGKSTLARLLAALAVPTQGEILFDGVDHRVVDHRALRGRIGLVLQRTHLFSATIADNIELGRPAHADDFITRLPLGYDTAVGESGVALSGGRQQRIALARALYGDPDIVILDEATTALDAETERAVQASVAEVGRGRTLIVIAHRLSTIRAARSWKTAPTMRSSSDAASTTTSPHTRSAGFRATTCSDGQGSASGQISSTVSGCTRSSPTRLGPLLTLIPATPRPRPRRHRHTRIHRAAPFRRRQRCNRLSSRRSIRRSRIPARPRRPPPAGPLRPRRSARRSAPSS
ncbi:MAG: ATP-binding cassette domain-containing protein [Myxococcota bacterium]